MQRTALTARRGAPKSTTATAEVKPLTEDAAAQLMWVHYRDNKARLISDIKEYRDSILSQLIAGQAVETVFAPFVKPLEPAKPVRRAA